MIPLMKPIMTEKMLDAARDAILNEKMVLGESVFKFEEEFARYIGTDYAVSVGSGTDGLIMSMVALNVKNIATTPATFAGTINAIYHAHGKPIFKDIDMDTYNIRDINCPWKNWAILPVHLYGYPCDMDSMGGTIIEDACQAHGASYKSRKVGSIGKAGIFSFYPSKNMTVGGDGGMVTTNDKKLANILKSMRHAGRRLGDHYVHDNVGVTSRLDTWKAAIGRLQLKELDKWNEQRRANASIYYDFLSDLDVVLPPRDTKDIEPVYHLFVVRTEDRDYLKEYLFAHNIASGIHYPIPVHKQPAFNFNETYSNAERLCDTCLSLPMYPDLKKSEIKYICEKIRKFFEC